MSNGPSLCLAVAAALAGIRATLSVAHDSSRGGYVLWVILAVTAALGAFTFGYFGVLRRRVLLEESQAKRAHPTALVFSCLCTPLLRANMDRQWTGTDSSGVTKRGSILTVVVDQAAWRFYPRRHTTPCYTVSRNAITDIEIADSTINDFRSAPVLGLRVRATEGPRAAIPVPVVAPGGWHALRLAPTDELRALLKRATAAIPA